MRLVALDEAREPLPTSDRYRALGIGVVVAAAAALLWFGALTVLYYRVIVYLVFGSRSSKPGSLGQ